MPKIKNEVYININVSISEFVLIVIGFFDLNNFHRYRKIDQDHVFNWAYLIAVNADLKLLNKISRKEVDEPKRGNSLWFHYRRYKLIQENSSLLTSGFKEQIDKLTRGDLFALEQLKCLLSTLKKNHEDFFPASIKGKTSHIDDSEDIYNLSELVECLYNNIDITGVKFIPFIQSIFNTLDKNSNTIYSESDNNDGYVKIDTLPNILQLMIKVSGDDQFDTASPSYDEVRVIDKLDGLAKEMNIYLKDNARTKKGLAEINAKKIISFIQKDKN